MGAAEGAGMLLLERLSDARRHGHPVLAVIRGSAVNQDGASNGLTAPNGPSQQRVIREALESAGLTADQVDAVEAHGTGTTLGDPIEAQAVLATYGRNRSRGPLHLGSVKSNIGHTQAAAGVLGVIKMVLALRHETLPATLHAQQPTPHVDWSKGQVELLTEARPWRAAERTRRAAVSSFGISGTNAHLVLEAAPRRDRPAPPAPATPPVWLISARNETALRAQARRLHTRLTEEPHDPFEVAHTLAAGRTAFAHRAAVVAADPDSRAAALRALAEGGSDPGLVKGFADGPGVAFLFTGQGSQRPGMGRGLYDAHPVFAAALDEVRTHLDPHLPRPLLEVMFAEPGSAEAGLLDRTDVAQSALFAFQTALYRLLHHHGVVPDCLVGHSIGEVVAAHVAGVFSLPDACTLVAARGRLMQSAPDSGAMVAVQATEAETHEALAGREDVAVAAVNSPYSVVIAGDRDAVLDVETHWRDRGRRTRRLRVSHAFHSAHMDGVLAEFRGVVEGLRLRPPQIPVVSNLTGQVADDGLLTSASYWADHVRGTVRFADGVRTAAARGAGLFVESGPQPALLPMAAESLQDAGPVAAPPSPPTLAAASDADDEQRAFVLALGRAHTRGRPVTWGPLLPETGLADLPTYPFQRAGYWIHAEAPPAGSADTGAPAEKHDAPEPDGAALREALSAADADGRLSILCRLVQEQAAAVLGHASAAQVGLDEEFLDIGFTSMTALELRNRLCAATGLDIPPSTLYDTPTPTAFADYLHERLQDDLTSKE
jgi:acyl transferase domain-containing protein